LQGPGGRAQEAEPKRWGPGGGAQDGRAQEAEPRR